jgi:hypothetical protein
MMEASLSAMDTFAKPLDATLPTPDVGSETFLDWADKLFAPATNYNHLIKCVENLEVDLFDCPVESVDLHE